MGVLIIQPNWAGWSELWAMQMITALEPHLVAIGANNPTESTWQGRVPILRLADTPVPRWRYWARRLGLPIASRPGRTAQQILTDAVLARDVDTVLVHYLEYALRFADVWTQTDKPLFVHCHGYDTEWDLRHYDAPHRRVFSPGYVVGVRRLAERAILIANSHHTAERLTRIGIPARRIVVKHLGTSVPPAPPTRCARLADVHVVFIGRLVDCKAPDLTIRAFEQACARGLEGRLTLAGDGPLRMACELLQRRSPFADRIFLPGIVDPPTGRRLREDADIFTAHNCRGPLTRQTEAFGVSFIEAMAAGLPVVTGRSGGVCETIQHGKTGILFEPGDVDAHAEALLNLARHPDERQRLGQAGWQRVRDHFSADKEQAELRAILNLADRPPCPAPSSDAQPAEAPAVTLDGAPVR
jgi:glycosyltransferase involved in cell wall biosynthesis